jgi:hypothetical protein
MTTQSHKFLSLLGNKKSYDANALIEIQKLAVAYPASHIVQALLAKILKDQGSFEYTQRLRIAAITSPSRMALFNYLESNTTSELDLKIETPEKVKEINSTSQIKTILVPVEEEPEGENSTYVLEKIESENDFVKQIQIQTLDNTDVKFTESAEELILKQIVAHAIPIEQEIENKTTLVQSEVDVNSIDKGKMDSIINDPLEREIVSDAINKSIQHEVLQDALEEKAEVNESEIEEENVSGFSYWLNPGKSVESRRADKMKKIDKLIENFINNEPKIKPKKVQFFEPVKAAKESIVYDENLASEPLARIFEKQGYFDRAIQIYEKLMMKFPEKKVYFASRIEKVQEVIKNIKK